ncbi:MAG: single-stranded DNA-binding protein [Eubacterium sp.]|jgi:single-strand DNA-binding protein
MNSVMLVGRLTRKPEVRYTADQLAISRFAIAVDRPPRQGREREADFPTIVVFGKQAENCANYLDKGRLVAIEGRLQTGSYTNKDGQKVYTTEVIANRVEFLSSGTRDSEGGYGNQKSRSYSAPENETRPPFETSDSSEKSGKDDMPEVFNAIEDDIAF